MFISKASELSIIEENIGGEKLQALEEDAAHRGKDQFGAKEVKGDNSV